LLARISVASMTTASSSTGQEVGTSWTKSVSGKGEYVRKASQFRSWISSDKSSEFAAESGRYHLYVCYACPWAHRTLIVRELKGLTDAITVNVVDWYLKPGGWRFSPDKPECTADDVNGFNTLREVYTSVDPDYSANITVPVLYDKKKRTIVSNESAEIIIMLNSAFNGVCGRADLDLYPEELRAEIDSVNEFVYNNVNNGLYRAGFATAQEPYDEAVTKLFNALDDLENRLSTRRYLVGSPKSRLTLADVRLFTTLIRFDWVYHQHFKCNLRQLVDYPNLWKFTRDIYQLPGVSGTVNKEHIRKHYMMSHAQINPHGIVPIGPQFDLDKPHDREKLS
ncbi:hypothetical protein BOX15_Mlig005601g1, partial [Macrostomum lignano]